MLAISTRCGYARIYQHQPQQRSRQPDRKNTILPAHDRWSEWCLRFRSDEACHTHCSRCLSPFLVELNNMLFSRAKNENMTLFRCQHCSGGSSEASDQGRAHQSASRHDFHGWFLKKHPCYTDLMELDHLGTIASHQDMFKSLSNELAERAKSGNESIAFLE